MTPDDSWTARDPAASGDHPPRVERGIRVFGGEHCYLCDNSIRDGDTVVYYFDAAFWETGFLYHKSCWEEADLAAKQYGRDTLDAGPALVLPDVECARCGGAVTLGERVVREHGAVARDDGVFIPRVYHFDCHEKRT